MNYIERSISLKAGLSRVIPGERVTFEPDFLYLSRRIAEAVLEKAGEGETPAAFQANLILGFDYVPSPAWSRLFEDSPHQIVEEHEFSEIAVSSKSTMLVAGADVRTGAAGAMGLIPILLSPAASIQCLLTGKAEWTIPDTIYIEIHSGSGWTLDTKDLAEYLSGYYRDGLVGCGVIIGGDAICGMDKRSKVALLDSLYGMGASVAVYSPKGAMGQVESAIKIKYYTLRKMKRS
ncbi:hypothetical protein WQ57_07645 [Mesobacillus campisalis]|uniref:Uncharacterized protein n=1 Tax=Mesobacillus campisalis TaxID=1408103 RepID=A0A0M2SWD3_9BACI|nr:hypothetical protein [Mesobacillus campisalis]KKK38473.1 hypothetical protein WQ57_07645 [Mesobacillus campisalis]